MTTATPAPSPYSAASGFPSQVPEKTKRLPWGLLQAGKQQSWDELFLNESETRSRL